MYSRSYIVSDLDFLSAPPPPSILSFSDSWTPLIRQVFEESISDIS